MLTCLKLTQLTSEDHKPWLKTFIKQIDKNFLLEILQNIFCFVENFNSVMVQSQSSLQEVEESRKKISDLERELALAGKFILSCVSKKCQ